MGDVKALLNERMKKPGGASSKMAALAKQTANGNLSGFAGIFGISELTQTEKDYLQGILNEFSHGRENIKDDLSSLIAITSEVKAINNQAAILHGERIKKAQTILKKYKDGAFTTWLMAAYGNRQTPYNFLQYYEFYEAMPKTLRPQIESMPRQAIYTLASREGSLVKKQSIVESYNGQTKQQLLVLIREIFPLRNEDRRRQNTGEAIILQLSKVYEALSRNKKSISSTQKRAILELLNNIKSIVT